MLIKRFFTLCLALSFIISIFVGSNVASAMTTADLKAVNEGIPHLDLTECAEGENAPPENDRDGNVSGSTVELAKQILSNKNVTFWTTAPSEADPNWSERVPKGGNTESINTKDIVRNLSLGKQAYTTAANASNKYADINPNILKFIIDAAEKGKVQVNALTDRSHSDGSNHYKGEAIDLDLNTTVPVNELVEIAKKYDGSKNDETTHHHFDFTKRPDIQDGAGPDESQQGGLVYVVGDSYGVGLKNDGDLKNKLTDAEYSTSFDVEVGRAMTTPGSGKETALETLDSHKSEVNKADAIVVVLGTNPDDYDKNIPKFMTKIHKYNKNKEKAVVFWVNVGHQQSSLNDEIKKSNNAIDKYSSKENYSVVDWNGIVSDDSSNQYVAKGELHPTTKGYSKLATMISGAVTSNKDDTDNKAPSDSDKCVCKEKPDSDSPLSGKNNLEKIYNYFIGKGLEDFQAAGIVGNISWESGGSPTTAQGASSSGDGQMSAEEYVKRGWDQGQQGHAYGIVQWDPGGKLTDHAKPLSKASELQYQLDFLWTQLQGKGPVPEDKVILKDIKGTKNVVDAVWAFMGGNGYYGFERPGDPRAEERIAFAKKFLDENKGKSPTGNPADQPTTSGDCEKSSPDDSTSMYKNPLRDLKKLTRMRIDMGIDYGGIGPVYAVGNGKVITSMNGTSGWPGGNFVAYTLTDGAAKGKSIYFSESCVPKVKVGEKVTADTVICEIKTYQYPFNEIGWHVGEKGSESAKAGACVGGDHNGDVWGRNFDKFMKSIGAPGGAPTPNSTTSSCKIPKDWPTWK